MNTKIKVGDNVKIIDEADEYVNRVGVVAVVRTNYFNINEIVFEVGFDDEDCNFGYDSHQVELLLPKPLDLDWDEIDPIWNWVAMDKNGMWYAYEFEPTLENDDNPSLWKYEQVYYTEINIHDTVPDWTRSAIQRPVAEQRLNDEIKLPDSGTCVLGMNDIQFVNPRYFAWIDAGEVGQILAETDPDKIVSHDGKINVIMGFRLYPIDTIVYVDVDYSNTVKRGRVQTHRFYKDEAGSYAEYEINWEQDSDRELSYEWFRSDCVFLTADEAFE